MSDLGIWQSGGLLLKPDGKLLLSERIMAEMVMETPGCRLWVNEKTASVGVHLLRGEPEPPVPIERVQGRGGLLGVIDLNSALSAAGLSPGTQDRETPWRYFGQRHLLEVRIGEAPGPAPLKKQGFLDDYPGLED